MTLNSQIERFSHPLLFSGDHIAAAITEVCDGLADTGRTFFLVYVHLVFGAEVLERGKHRIRCRAAQRAK